MEEHELRRAIREAVREGVRDGILLAFHSIPGVLVLIGAIGLLGFFAFQHWNDVVGFGAMLAALVIEYPGLAVIAVVGVFGVVLIYRIISDANPVARPVREPLRIL